MMSEQKINRGDIYWVDFSKLKEIEVSSGTEINGKKRPALIVSEEWQNEKGRRVIVLPMSTKVKNIYRFDLYVGNTISDYRESKIVCEQIRSIDKRKLREKAGQLSKEQMEEVDEKLRKILVLQEKTIKKLWISQRRRLYGLFSRSRCWFRSWSIHRLINLVEIV